MSLNVWSDILEFPIPNRSAKPRQNGWTMVIDKGLGLHDTQSLLQTAASHIDLLKLTFGTSALYPEDVLCKKIKLLRDAGIHVYPGGTLLEIAVFQGKARPFLKRASELGFDFIEISDGTIPIHKAARYRLFDLARAEGLRILSEVGKKDPNAWENDFVEEIRMDLIHGAEKVIIEARESGKGIGIYDTNGQIKEFSLERICEGASIEQLMWEAPLKAQQAELIQRFGADVNLGNIPAEEVISLEALRRGLRADTLSKVLPMRRVPSNV